MPCALSIESACNWFAMPSSNSIETTVLAEARAGIARTRDAAIATAAHTMRRPTTVPHCAHTTARTVLLWRPSVKGCGVDSRLRTRALLRMQASQRGVTRAGERSARDPQRKLELEPSLRVPE